MIVALWSCCDGQLCVRMCVQHRCDIRFCTITKTCEAFKRLFSHHDACGGRGGVGDDAERREFSTEDKRRMRPLARMMANDGIIEWDTRRLTSLFDALHAVLVLLDSVVDSVHIPANVDDTAGNS